MAIISLIKRSVFLGLLLLLIPVMTKAQDKAQPLVGALESMGYGYEVQVQINGTPMPQISGKSYQGMRIFGKNHPLKSQAPAEQQDIFVLQEGPNKILVQFKKLDQKPTALEVSVKVPKVSSAPLFQLKSQNKPSGKIEKTFYIKKDPNLKTIQVTDQDL